MTAAAWGAAADPVAVEPLAGSDHPAQYLMAETLDGLYAPYSLRLPAGDGPHPFVLIAYGNGGGGMAWLHSRVHRFRHITDVLLEAGYACGWVRYRTEVELGYQTGGPLRTIVRQGMGLMNRAPLEYEDEVAVLRHVATHPAIDGDRLFHVGVSHAGEMLFKLLSQYPGLLRAGVAAEPASHELLTLRLDDVETVTTTDGLRDIESIRSAAPSAPGPASPIPTRCHNGSTAWTSRCWCSAATRTSSKESSASPTSCWPRSTQTPSGAPGPTTPRLHLPRDRRLRRRSGR